MNQPTTQPPDTASREVGELPPILTVEQAAKYLMIGRSAAYEAVRLGQIPSVRIGRLIRISRTALLDWLATAEGIEESRPAGEHWAAGPKEEARDGHKRQLLRQS